MLRKSSASFLKSASRSRSRWICTVRGELVSPLTNKSMVVRARDMNFMLDNESDLQRVDQAMEELPKDRIVAVNWREVVDPRFEQTVLNGSYAGLRSLMHKELRYKNETVTKQLLSRLRLQKTTIQFLIAALEDLPMPADVDVMHCVEALDIAQIMMSGRKDCFDSRQDANRLYPGGGAKERSHPSKPRGVYLMNDLGTVALLDARLPINCGTSGTSSNVMNAWFNLTGQQRMSQGDIRQMASLLHGYLAGRFLIDLNIPQVEEGVQKFVQDKALYDLLVRTGMGQTHTLGEVVNACMLTDAAQAKGGDLSDSEKSEVIKGSVELTRQAMD
jgi:hypothetical protein